jgi:hypothetical protein
MNRLNRNETARAFALASVALALGAAAVAAPQAPPPAPSRAGVGIETTAPPAAPAAARAADGLPTPPPVISSEQIDRYDAIKQLQKAVKDNPKSLADWVTLGELAHEVAMDAPADRAGEYFTLSRDAFEKALALAPNNPGLTAAVQFSRDQMANADAFEKSRDLATVTYLEARRRDLAATNYTPYIRVYGTSQAPLAVRSRPGAITAGAGPGAAPAAGPVPTAAAPATGPNANLRSSGPLNAPGRTPAADAAQAITPSRRNASSTDAANFGTQQNYSLAAANPAIYSGGYPGPFYRPFAVPGGPPFTYVQYSSSYFPPNLLSNPAVPPVTLQRAQLPAVRPNAFEQSILNRAGAAPPPNTGPDTAKP